MSKIFLNTDGGARGNPGPAGVGIVISRADGTIVKEASRPLGWATNNVAEYQAVIFGLETLKQFFSKAKLKETEVEVRLDSELVAKQLRGEYQIKEENLFPFFINIWTKRVTDFPHLTFTHIPREANHRADLLANEAMDRQAEPPALI